MPAAGKAVQVSRALVARKRHLRLLVASSPEQEQLLARLGRHKMGKSCLYIRKLADVDMGIPERLIEGSVAEVKRRHG